MEYKDQKSSITMQDPDENTPGKFSTNAIYLARTAQINTLTLSQMADQKASILIGSTFVVFSLVVTKLLGGGLTLSILCLSLTAFVSTVCAVIAVLPTSKGQAPPDADLNPLFFGTFANIDEDAWQESLIREFQDDEAVLRIMLRDIYQNGQVLHRRKYRFLNYAYRAFLAGLALTMMAYFAEIALDMEPLFT